MGKILFWLLNIIISSNCIIIAIFVLFLKKLGADFDPTKEYPLEFISIALSFGLYILLKLFLFYVIPVKKIKYCNDLFSRLISSDEYYKNFLLKIFIMDVIFALILSIIICKDHIWDVGFILATNFMVFCGGILPSYFIYLDPKFRKRKFEDAKKNKDKC